MKNLFTPEKFVEGTILGVDGNAYVLMGTFQKLAGRQQWSDEDVEKVLDEAMSEDYSHLVSTLVSHMTMK